MKTLLYLGAFALLLSGGAAAQSGTVAAHEAKQAQRHGAAHKTRPVRMHRPAEKDPWAAYWKDPSRYEFPSWGYRGGW